MTTKKLYILSWYNGDYEELRSFLVSSEEDITEDIAFDFFKDKSAIFHLNDAAEEFGKEIKDITLDDYFGGWWSRVTEEHLFIEEYEETYEI